MPNIFNQRSIDVLEIQPMRVELLPNETFKILIDNREIISQKFDQIPIGKKAKLNLIIQGVIE